MSKVGRNIKNGKADSIITRTNPPMTDRLKIAIILCFVKDGGFQDGSK